MARAVIIGGKRTPFFKAFGPLVELDAIALGTTAVKAALSSLGLAAPEVDAIYWGTVIIPPASPNVAREIALECLTPRAEAMTVSRACASGLQAITSAVAAVERGEADVVVAGGSDSTSNAAIPLPPGFIQKMGPVLMGGKGGAGDIFSAAAKLNWAKDVLPTVPKIAERSTGETMGQGAERMAERNGITRAAQDEFALRSHERAALAVKNSRFDAEVCSVVTPRGTVSTDGLIRGDSSLEKLARLKPAFKKGGTVTAGNSSPLTDGAACVVVMNEERARVLGYKPLAAVRSSAYVGVDPKDQLLIGPALAIPKALDRAGLTLADMNRIDLHEAFAAQCLSVTQALQSDAFARERLGKPGRVGSVDDAKLNVHGGSLAIGHPFGATGARMVLTMSNELALLSLDYAVLGLCAAGGLGAAAVLERV
jgi:acetyl-CoA acyltransferase